jgi:hypothetical protein
MGSTWKASPSRRARPARRGRSSPHTCSRRWGFRTCARSARFASVSGPVHRSRGRSRHRGAPAAGREAAKPDDGRGATMRIVVAMSGGVDSSVAAALLAEQGHDVIGVSMQLYDQREGQGHFGTCCTIDDLYDARRVAAVIGIPHYIVNFETRFDEQVVSNFISEYAAGRTPIPCAHCNSDLKFATLLERALGFGADRLATGHYARIEPLPDGSLAPAARRRCRQGPVLLPVLAHAGAAGPRGVSGRSSRQGDRPRACRAARLRVAAKPDSQEICFVPDGDYAGFIEKAAPELKRPGTHRRSDRARSSAAIRVCIASPSASARGWGSRRRSRFTSWRSARRLARSSWGRAARSAARR